jgi:S-DNA-T family DNA segregation ATPase FtsK/SpoIIIE
VNPYQRLLVAGESGAGLSVALRPLLAAVAADPLAALVYIDAKRVEGALWRSRARIARDGAEITAVAAELAAEMMARLEEMETQGRATWKPTKARPRLVVVVDEGAEVMTLAKAAMEHLSSVARMGRAAEVHLWWCTQKPTQGQGGGIDPQISAQMGVQLCLKVKTPGEARTVLGEDATAEGWHANKLPKPGHVLIRGEGRGPVAVRVWHLDDEQVKALPEREPWQGQGSASVSLVKPSQAGGPVRPSAGPVAPPLADDTKAAVLAALVAAESPVSRAQLVTATGRGKSAVGDALAALVAEGQAERTGAGSATRYTTAKEATA